LSDAARALFDTLNDFSDLQQLVDAGEAEGLHLECKSPAEPRLSKDLRAKLAEAASGFSNTSGGVILWGVCTTKHAQSGLDVISALQPIGNVASFAKQIERSLPGLTTPALTSSLTKVLTDPAGKTRGVIVTLIPQTLGDPIQSTVDERFHFRNGDEFTTLPYVMLQRLFAATKSPDLRPVFQSAIVKIQEGGEWRIPVALENRSSAVARDVIVVVEIENPSACSTVKGDGLTDISAVNPGRSIFRHQKGEGVHRGLNHVVGALLVKMQVAKRAKRTLRVAMSIYADHMRARVFRFSVSLAKKRFSVRVIGEGLLY